LTNAIILPYVMTYNRRFIDEKSQIIARALNLPAHSYDGFLSWVLKLRSDLGIPHSLAAIGVSIDKAAIIGSEAAVDPSAGGNPVPVNAAQLEHIFRAAVEGNIESVIGAK
jgi:alcohol dehydrogenase class IV